MNNYDRHRQAIIAATRPRSRALAYPKQNHNATRARRAEAARGAIRRFVITAAQLFPK